MITIYHNPRCSKSRQALAILEKSGKDFTIRPYLKEPLSLEEYISIFEKYDGDYMDLLRTNEQDWKNQKELYKEQNPSKPNLIQLFMEFPKLMQRAIVINGNTAIIARPPELIKNIL